MIYTAGMEVPRKALAAAARAAVCDEQEDQDSEDVQESEGFQPHHFKLMEDHVEHEKMKLRSWRDATEEQIKEEAESIVFEMLRPQRYYMQAALTRAKNRAAAMGIFPNRNDYMTTVENFYCTDVATAMCTAVGADGGRLGNSIEEVAERCVKAEAGSAKLIKRIDELEDIVNAQDKLIREAGPGRGNKK